MGNLNFTLNVKGRKLKGWHCESLCSGDGGSPSSPDWYVADEQVYILHILGQDIKHIQKIIFWNGQKTILKSKVFEWHGWT